MAVTNLTGYTWVGNNVLTENQNILAHIDYISNNIQYDYIYLSYDGYDFELFYSEYDCAYNSDEDGWTNSAYKTIVITGGTDVTNTNLITWLEANGTLTAPAPADYEVTFVTNGGTSVTKLENVEELPTPLPTTTKSNNVFVGWFYDSGFEVQAYSGDELTANVTLYAKWYANMSDFYKDVADAIRSKNGETNPIKHTDFAYKIKNIQGAKPEETKTVTPDFLTGNVVVTPTSGKVMSQVTINKDSNLIANNIKNDVTVHGITSSSFIAIELTQAQYDALAVYDDDTYYLIVEE